MDSNTDQMRDQLHERWLEWVHDALGRDGTLSEIAAHAAAEAAARHEGFNAAAASARLAWDEAARSLSPDRRERSPDTSGLWAGMLGGAAVPNRAQVIILIAITSGVLLLATIGYDIGTNCWTCGGWLGPIGALVGSIEFGLCTMTLAAVGCLAVSLRRSQWALRTAIALFALLATFYFVSAAALNVPQTLGSLLGRAALAAIAALLPLLPPVSNWSASGSAPNGAVSLSGTSKGAVVSLIAGLTAFIACPVAAALVAIVVGHSVRMQTRPISQSSVAWATSGLVLGYLNVVVVLVMIFAPMVVFVIGKSS